MDEEKIAQAYFKLFYLMDRIKTLDNFIPPHCKFLELFYLPSSRVCIPVLTYVALGLLYNVRGHPNHRLFFQI